MINIEDSIDTTTSHRLSWLTPAQRLQWLADAIGRSPRLWHAVAKAVDAVALVGPDQSGEPSGPQIIAAAAQAAGVSAQVIRRYVSALRRTRELAASAGLPPDALLSGMFNLQEVAVRLCERSPEEGLPALRDHVAGRNNYGLFTFRQMLARAPAPAGSAARREVQHAKSASRDLLEKALQDHKEELWGAGTSVRRRQRLRYFGGTGLEVIGTAGEIVAGIDLFLPYPGENHDLLASRAAASLAIAPFFRSFHFAFAASEGDDGPVQAKSLLEWLGHSWIGVIVVDTAGQVTILRPADGSPVPDMSPRYEALKRKFRSSDKSVRARTR